MRRISKPALAMLLALCPAAAHAELPLAAVIAQGRAVIDLRVRYETVDDASRALDANGTTVRARLGYETGYWNSLQLAFDFDQIWTVGGATLQQHTQRQDRLSPSSSIRR